MSDGDASEGNWIVKSAHGSSFQLNAATFILDHNGIAEARMRLIGPDACAWRGHLSLTRGPERLLDVDERPAYLITEFERENRAHWR